VNRAHTPAPVPRVAVPRPPDRLAFARRELKRARERLAAADAEVRRWAAEVERLGREKQKR
jgi:hypothetical protein